MLLWPRGLLRARSRFPEIVGNITNAEQRMEVLEGANALARQALSRSGRQRAKALLGQGLQPSVSDSKGRWETRNAAGLLLAFGLQTIYFGCKLELLTRTKSVNSSEQGLG